MKKLKKTSKLLALAAMTVIGAATIWAVTSRVSANPVFLQCPGGCITPRFSFGMLGITSQQTARFSVVNVKKCAVGHTCAPAQVDLSFVNDSGSPFTNADGYPIASSSVTLAAGQSAFLELHCPGGCTAPNRVQFRAEMPSCIGCGSGRGTVLATLELFDTATGKTTLVMPDYPAISSNGEDE